MLNTILFFIINKINFFCNGSYEICFLSFFYKIDDIKAFNNSNLVYSNFQFNYFLLFLFFCCAVFFSFLLFFINYMLVKKNKYYDKALPYECGFDVIGSPRVSFNVQFYIIAILFLIFDVELVITYP